jgi:hypothetical protein
MTCWQGAGSGPLYVCDDHAKTLSSKEIPAAFGIGNKQTNRSMQHQLIG